MQGRLDSSGIGGSGACRQPKAKEGLRSTLGDERLGNPYRYTSRIPGHGNLQGVLPLRNNRGLETGKAGGLRPVMIVALSLDLPTLARSVSKGATDDDCAGRAGATYVE